jgi:hypothetical protein
VGALNVSITAIGTSKIPNRLTLVRSDALAVATMNFIVVWGDSPYSDRQLYFDVSQKLLLPYTDSSKLSKAYME